jgi:hypothetical protein
MRLTLVKGNINVFLSSTSEMLSISSESLSATQGSRNLCGTHPSDNGHHGVASSKCIMSCGVVTGGGECKLVNVIFLSIDVHLLCCIVHDMGYEWDCSTANHSVQHYHALQIIWWANRIPHLPDNWKH